uniref:Membrane transport protein MMPL domain-containing protein n=1 Tax=candidate division WWE3 bacterium TaxID=2053526 RepID=A0A832E0L6_UNCKA
MVSTFGITLAISYLLAVFLFWRLGKQEGFSTDDLFDAALFVSLFGLGGGKLLPLWVKVPGGFFWFGAILAGLLALYLFALARRWSFLRLGSIIGLAASFGQAAGFLGAWLLKIGSLLEAGGYLLVAAVLYLIYRNPVYPKLPLGTVLFLYLVSVGILFYVAGNWGAPVLAGLGAGGLGWIAIKGVFKVKRSHG